MFIEVTPAIIRRKGDDPADFLTVLDEAGFDVLPDHSPLTSERWREKLQEMEPFAQWNPSLDVTAVRRAPLPAA